jgi:serine/threonine protein kinase
MIVNGLFAAQVAIKKMKKRYASLNEALSLREYRALHQLPHHPNVVPLLECFYSPAPIREFFFVMEYVDGGDLYQFMKASRASGKTTVDSETVRSLTYVILDLPLTDILI